MLSNPQKTVCIFCGSGFGNQDSFRVVAKTLAERLVASGWRIVYGGARVGIMGCIADSALNAGGEVIGVIPKSLFEKEVAHSGLAQLYTVDSMHQRKQKMFDLSDAFITLPGGFGTMDETFEILTWMQIGLHKKPLILFNQDGYYDSILNFISNAQNRGLVQDQHVKLVQTAASIEEVLLKLS